MFKYKFLHIALIFFFCISVKSQDNDETNYEHALYIPDIFCEIACYFVKTNQENPADRKNYVKAVFDPLKSLLFTNKTLSKLTKNLVLGDDRFARQFQTDLYNHLSERITFMHSTIDTEEHKKIFAIANIGTPYLLQFLKTDFEKTHYSTLKTMLDAHQVIHEEPLYQFVYNFKARSQRKIRIGTSHSSKTAPFADIIEKFPRSTQFFIIAALRQRLQNDIANVAEFSSKNISQNECNLLELQEKKLLMPALLPKNGNKSKK